jgi:hypothetical protein
MIVIDITRFAQTLRLLIVPDSFPVSCVLVKMRSKMIA